MNLNIIFGQNIIQQDLNYNLSLSLQIKIAAFACANPNFKLY